jgi:ABC-2 type transport system ATP-binding protein
MVPERPQLMEIIEDIIEATSGEILYKGKRARTGSFREEIGIQFQHTALLSFLTVEETLATFSRLFTRPADTREIIRPLSIGRARADSETIRLSGGQAQRLMLALAFDQSASTGFPRRTVNRP